MTKRKTKKPKTISEAKVRRLAAQFEAVAKDSRREYLSTDCASWRLRAEVFFYCAIAMRQQLLGRAK